MKVKNILLLSLLISFTLVVFGCSSVRDEQSQKTFSEQDVHNAVTELMSGINNGDIEVVQKYVGTAGPVAEKIVEKLKNNVRLSNVRDIKIQGTNAQATVNLEVVPLNVNKEITLNFDVSDVLLLDNPLGLLTILL